MSDIALFSTIHVDEDTSTTVSLREILAEAGFVTTAPLQVASFETDLPDGSYTPGDSPLLGLVDSENLYIRPGAWAKDYNGEFVTYQFLVEDKANGNYVTLELRVVVDPVNDAPTGADRDFDLANHDPVVLTSDDFGFVDAVEGDAFKSVIVESLPAAGTILLDGVAITASTEITVGDIQAGKLTFVPSSTSGGIVELAFHVRDNGGTVGTGAQDTSVATNYLTFKVPTPGTGAPGLATIGDTVWEDDNANGIQDSGEAGIANATVALRDSAGNVIETVSTDANGHYAFNVGNGTYTVAVTAPQGYVASAKGAGTDATVDSDIGADGVSGAITVVKGDVNNDTDAGLYRYASVASTVWTDTDRDGTIDATEQGIGNVKVSLLDAGGNTVATAVTDTNGQYQFGDLKPGTYSLKFDAATLPAGVTFVDGSGTTEQVTLTSGQHAAFEEAAIAPAAPVAQPGTIASTVWEDKDADGIQDSGETGIAGVKVKLVNASGATVATTTTDARGNYTFTTAAGDYSVQVTKPVNTVFTSQNTGTNDAVDSDVNAGGNSATFTVKAGATIDPADAGVYRTASLGNKVWYDCDGDGIQEAGESGIKGVKVTLLDGNGKALAITSTDAAGQYAFTGLKPGTYSVQFDDSALPSGYVLTRQNAGSNDALDSDADANGLSQKVTLVSGEYNTSIDAGVAQAATIGDRVWLDADADGIQDSGEAGVANVVMTLTDGQGAVVATTKTDANGYYGFSVAAGTYSVGMKTPDGYGITKQYATNSSYDSNANASGNLGTVTVRAGEAVRSLDAGLTQGGIRSTVWEDSDFDGVQDKGEYGIGGVTVKLYDANHKLKATTVTASDGSYAFDKLAAGSYSVEVTRATGWYTTKANVGSDALDSDFTNVGTSTVASSGVFKLASGELKTDVDAGLYRKASIGDKVWRDGNHNGVQDRGEEGIGKIKVMLYDAVTNKLLSATTTDSSGSYLFGNLDPGSYYLKFDKTNVKFTDAKGYSYALNDWKWGVKNTGTNDLVDSDVKGDAVSKTGLTQTDATFLSSGENDMSWDAAITPIAIDLNGDGIHTISRADFTGSFDLLGNGTAIKSGWLSSSDAFLAIDANGNGRIDDISELFGGVNKGSGFARLASFDSNGDGFVTAGDAQFAALTLWQDANSNGITDAGELVSLAQAGVTSLAVAFEELPFLDANGNLHLERSSALVNGQEVSMTDVYFNVSVADVSAAGLEAATIAQLIGQSDIVTIV